MIRLEIYQESAHFRIPTVGNPYLSFPLPPPSTVYGFLRCITDYKSINYENTKISIQGNYEGISFEKERLILEGKGKIKTNIIPIQKLHQCKWIIHIKSPFEKDIIEAINSSSKIFRLGRREDLIIDLNLKVDLEEKEFNMYKYNYKRVIDEKKEALIYIYQRWYPEENLKGSLFNMSLDSIVNEKKEIIGYKPINVIYSNIINATKKLFDGEYIISWL